MGEGDRRIAGIDVARALAIWGMLVAHLRFEGIAGFDLTAPTSWWSLADGFPSAFFALLSGVSVVIISRRAVAAGGVPVLRSRMGLVARGVLLFVFGVVLQAVQTEIVIVLTVYGVVFVLLSMLVRWSSRALAILLGVVFVVWPVVLGLVAVFPRWKPGGEFFGQLVFGPFPVAAWLVYALVGMLAMRHGIATLRGNVVLGGSGLGAVFAGWGIMVLSGVYRSPLGDIDQSTPESLTGRPFRGVASTSPDPSPEAFGRAAAAAAAHSGGALDMLLSIGVGLLVLAVCLLVCRVRVGESVLLPVRRAGAMPLTVYVGHVLVTAAVIGGFALGGSPTGSTPSMGASPSGLPGRTAGATRPDVAHEVTEPAETPAGAPTDTDSREPGAGSDSSLEGKLENDPERSALLLWTPIGAMVFALLWFRFFRRGPLEWLVHVVSRRAARADLAPVPDRDLAPVPDREPATEPAAK